MKQLEHILIYVMYKVSLIGNAKIIFKNKIYKKIWLIWFLLILMNNEYTYTYMSMIYVCVVMIMIMIKISKEKWSKNWDILNN